MRDGAHGDAAKAKRRQARVGGGMLGTESLTVNLNYDVIMRIRNRSGFNDNALNSAASENYTT